MDAKSEGLNVHVPSIAGSNRVGMPEEEINIPAHERCPACFGSGHRPRRTRLHRSISNYVNSHIFLTTKW